MQAHEALQALRGAARELASASQPGTPTGAGAAAGGSDAALCAPSTANLLLQISALHKAFLALSEAQMEELNARGAEREEMRVAVASCRSEFATKLQATEGLHAEVQELAAVAEHGEARQVALQRRCGALEREVAHLRGMLESQQQQPAPSQSALEAAVEAAVARHVAAAGARWAAEALPPLLQPLQEAVGATAELAAQVAGDVGGLAAAAEELAARCARGDAGQADHEQRLSRLEEAALAGGMDDQQQQQQDIAQLHEAVHILDEAVQQVQQQQQWQEQQPWQAAPDSLAGGLPSVQAAVAAVAEQQAQQAKTTEQLVQSVLADVTALARHTKALDKEVRGLRREAAQTQAALLQSCSTFSRALSIPSPLGPFSSFPPQP